MRPCQLVAVGLLLGCSDPEQDSAATTQRPRALFVGMDGVRPDALQVAAIPELDSLLPQAAYSFRATTHLGADTSSAPGWTSIFTGVQADKHGVWENGDYDGRDDAYPSFMLRAVEQLGASTSLAYQWADIGMNIVEYEAVNQAYWSGDEEIALWTAEAIGDEAFDLHAVVFDDTDHAGHEYGFDAEAAGYLAAIEEADRQLGLLLEAIEARPASEDWLVVVTTDHGGEGTSHGEQNEACQTIWLVVAGQAVQPGELAEASHMDVHPTILNFLGLPPQEDYDLDGQVRGLEQGS